MCTHQRAIGGSSAKTYPVVEKKRKEGGEKEKSRTYHSHIGRMFDGGKGGGGLERKIYVWNTGKKGGTPLSEFIGRRKKSRGSAVISPFSQGFYLGKGKLSKRVERCSPS